MRDYALLAKAFRHCAENGLCSDCPMYDNCPDLDGKKNAADAIEELLDELTTIRKQFPRWTSVEDELPEEWRAVLAYMPIHSDEKNPHMIRICWYIGYGKWRETEYGEIVEIPVTHWMHLPAPPSETKKKMLEKEHKEFMKKVNEANAISYARRVKQQSEEVRKLREEIEKLDESKVLVPPKEVLPDGEV